MANEASMICCLCDNEIKGYGNDPWPLKVDGVCCDNCNYSKVIPERIRRFQMATVLIRMNCRTCGKPKSVVVPKDGYTKWKEGKALIQDAMPNVSPSSRELLVSGICPDCWDEMFGGDDA